MDYVIPNGVGYSPDAGQRIYRPPVKPEPFTPPAVQAHAAATEGTVVQRTHQAFMHAQNEFQRHVEATMEHRDKYSDSGYLEQLQAFSDTPAAKAVDQGVAEVQARRDSAQKTLEEIYAELSPDGDTAAELRATRYWNRTKAVLDTLNTDEMVSAAQNLIANADHAELGTLLQELGSYVTSRGHTTEWIEPTVARVVPEFARARAQLTKAQQSLQIAEYNAKALRRSFTEGRTTTVLVDPASYDPDR